MNRMNTNEFSEHNLNLDVKKRLITSCALVVGIE